MKNILEKVDRVTRDNTCNKINVVGWNNDFYRDILFRCNNGNEFIRHYDFFYYKRCKCNGCSNKCEINKRKKSNKENCREKFFEKINEMFGGSVTYDRNSYIDSFTPIEFTCVKHGDFKISPNRVKDNAICPGCRKEKMFINRLMAFKEIAKNTCHKDLDINNIKDYNGWHKNCKIWCNNHGYVEMKPSSIRSGAQCPLCYNEEKSKENVTEAFKNKFYGKFGHDEYDIDDCCITKLSDYVTVHTKKYGDIIDKANSIIRRKKFPLKIYKDAWIESEKKRVLSEKEEKLKHIKEENIKSKLKNLQEHFNWEYQISYSHECGSYKYFTLNCLKHGQITMSYDYLIKHLRCPMCEKEEDLNERKENFIRKCKIVHQSRYNYDNIIYINKHSYVKNIKCPIHGYFDINAGNHLHGHGCPRCQMSKLEEKIYTMLFNEKIDFIFQYKNKKILGSQSLDFYIPNINLGIECQGRQHYENKSHFGLGQFDYDMQIKRDTEKFDKCNLNNIELIYYADKKYSNEKIVYTNINDVLIHIKKKYN